MRRNNNLDDPFAQLMGFDRDIDPTLGGDNSLASPRSGSALAHRRRVFEDHRVGLIIVNDQREIIYINKEAERILSLGILVASKGRVKAPTEATDTLLQSALDGAIRNAADKATRDEESVVSLEKGGESPLFIRISNIIDADGKIWFKIAIIDPTFGMLPSSSLLRRLFRLTPAEARVAQLLAKGMDVKTIMRLRNVSEPTVRHQIRNLLLKTGTSKQSHLVAVLIKCAALMTISLD